MEILVLFKYIPVIGELSDRDWKQLVQDGSLNESVLNKEISAYDESALELSLRFRDRCSSLPFECALSAATAGNTSSITPMKTLSALGFDHTDIIDLHSRSLYESGSASGLLLSYIRHRDTLPDIIVTGYESGDLNSKKTPLLLSEGLGIRCITHVTDFIPVSEKTIRISYSTDCYDCTEDVSCPIILSVGDVPSTLLRIPTLRQRLAAKSQKVEIISPDTLMDNTCTDNTLSLLSISKKEEKRPCHMLEGNVKEMAQYVYQNCIRGLEL